MLDFKFVTAVSFGFCFCAGGPNLGRGNGIAFWGNNFAANGCGIGWAAGWIAGIEEYYTE